MRGAGGMFAGVRQRGELRFKGGLGWRFGGLTLLDVSMLSLIGISEVRGVFSVVRM